MDGPPHFSHDRPASVYEFKVPSDFGTTAGIRPESVAEESTIFWALGGTGAVFVPPTVSSFPAMRLGVRAVATAAAEAAVTVVADAEVPSRPTKTPFRYASRAAHDCGEDDDDEAAYSALDALSHNVTPANAPMTHKKYMDNSNLLLLFRLVALLLVGAGLPLALLNRMGLRPPVVETGIVGLRWVQRATKRWERKSEEGDLTSSVKS